MGTDLNVKRSRGGLVFKAHRLLHHSTLGLRVIKKKKKKKSTDLRVGGAHRVAADLGALFHSCAPPHIYIYIYIIIYTYIWGG